MMQIHSTAITPVNMRIAQRLIFVLFVWLCMTPSLAAQSSNQTTTALAEDDLALVLSTSNLADSTQPLGEALSPLSESLGVPNTAIDEDVQTRTHSTTSNAPDVASNELILNDRVVDAARILSASEKAQLNEQLKNINDAHLAQAALVIVPSTNGVAIFDYALDIAKRWQLGDKDHDNGLLIVVAVNDRNIYMLTGHGIEGALPDAAIKRIIRNDITPAFKQNAYAQGLSAGIGRLHERLLADPETLARADTVAIDQQGGTSAFALFGLLHIFVFSLIAGSIIKSLLGRLLGSSAATGLFTTIALASGASLATVAIAAFVLWLFLLMSGNNSRISRHKGGGFSGGGSFGGDTGGGFGSGSFGGSFGGGGFGSGGGFSGGGGSFGGGGAGGSW